MILGFTGTQIGMTAAQKEQFTAVVLETYFDEFHHGGCIGADAQAHMIVARIAGFDRIQIWPGDNEKKQDLTLVAGVRHPPMDNLKRNRKIASIINQLIACPRQYREFVRSGTWATVRYAEARKVPVTIIYPDGRVTT